MGGGLESRCVGRVYGADGADRPRYKFIYNKCDKISDKTRRFGRRRDC